MENISTAKAVIPIDNPIIKPTSDVSLDEAESFSAKISRIAFNVIADLYTNVIFYTH